MMKFTQGNLLEAPVEALVNTVNTVGVMGKGIALMFKEAFPGNFHAYEDACKHKEVKIGHMYYMIHASDHEDAPALMVRAHSKAVRSLSETQGLLLCWVVRGGIQWELRLFRLDFSGILTLEPKRSVTADHTDHSSVLRCC